MPLHEYDAAAPYLHLLMMTAWEGLRGQLADEMATVDPSAGAVVELGAGTGIGTDLVLDTVPSAPVLALEPSAALRAVLIARLVSHPQAERLTVLPCTAQDAVLPERICAVLGAHVVGHLDPADRRRLWRELAARLGPGAPVLLTAEGPETPVMIPWFPPIEVRAAGLAYRVTGSAEPDGPDAVRWRMRYDTRSDDGVVLHTAETAYRYHTVGVEALAAELYDAGLLITTCADGRVFARAPGPVPPRARPGGLRAHDAHRPGADR